MIEQESEEVITEDGKESAVRSAELMLPKNPGFAACLMQYASNYRRLLEQAEGEFAVVTGGGSSAGYQTFLSAIEGLRYATANLSDQTAIVHRVSRLGILSSSTFVPVVPYEFFKESSGSILTGEKTRISSTRPLPIQTQSRITQIHSDAKTLVAKNTQIKGPPTRLN